MDREQFDEVRQAIERNTSKVSLRELEKKGFRRVKVLKSNDINQLIRQAVLSVMSKRQAMNPTDQEAMVRESREELDRLMRRARASQQQQQQLTAEKAELERRVGTAEAEKQRLAAEVRGLEEQLRSSRGRGADPARVAELEAQLQQARMVAQQAQMQAQARQQAEEDARRARARAREEVDEVEARMRQLRQGAQAELEGAQQRLRSEQQRAHGLELEVQRLQAELQKAEAAGGDESADEKFQMMFGLLLGEIRSIKETASTRVVQADEGGLKDELSKMSSNLAAQIARMSVGPRGDSRKVEELLHDAEVAIASIFEEDVNKSVESNIDAMHVKTEKKSGVKSNLAKLKSLRKGGLGNGE